MSVTLHEILESLYGVKTIAKVNSVVDDVDSTVKKILNNNPNRVSVIIFNLGASPIYVSPFNDVSSTKGMYVAPLGGSIVIQWDTDFTLVSNEFYAISALDNQSVMILENISL